MINYTVTLEYGGRERSQNCFEVYLKYPAAATIAALSVVKALSGIHAVMPLLFQKSATASLTPEFAETPPPMAI